MVGYRTGACTTTELPAPVTVIGTVVVPRGACRQSTVTVARI